MRNFQPEITDMQIYIAIGCDGIDGNTNSMSVTNEQVGLLETYSGI